jgi:Multiubiquitin
MDPEIERVENSAMPAKSFELDIEGKTVVWNAPTVTTEEIARLGGWDPSQGVIMVDRDNNERTLGVNERVEIKPGLGFGKRVRWKRG